MAAPTPVKKIFWDGTRGMIRWYAAWTDGSQLTDSQMIDISADLSPAPDSIKIRSVDLVLNGDIDVALEFDASTDELLEHLLGQTDVTFQFYRDYTDAPNEGYTPTSSAAGFTGDLLLTTLNAASGDEVNALIVFEKS